MPISLKSKTFKALKAMGKGILNKAMGIKKKKKTKPGAVDDNATKRIKRRNIKTQKTLRQLSGKVNAHMKLVSSGVSPSTALIIKHQIKSAYKKVGLK